MWAIGIILYKLLSKGNHPFPSNSKWGYEKEIIKEYATLPDKVSPFMKEMVAKLLQKNPEIRPDAFSLLTDDIIWK
jgi:serine/threonine protein kinase